MKTLATIGYESTTVQQFIATLKAQGIEVLVDVRAVAGSRRVGFAKTRLAAHLSEADIEYIHLRGLGTPSEGRAAARAGRHDELRTIFGEHLHTAPAQEHLEMLANLVRSGRPVCLMCLEADPAHCHRSMVADAVKAIVPVEIHHLSPQQNSPDEDAE